MEREVLKKKLENSKDREFYNIDEYIKEILRSYGNTNKRKE